MSLDASSLCNAESTLVYKSEYGEAFILLVPTSDDLSGTSVQVSSTCAVTSCHASQFMGSEGTCVDCPLGAVSIAGSTNESDCFSCFEAGAVPQHPKSSNCALGDDVLAGIPTGRAWRVMTIESLTNTGWHWDVNSLRFYSSEDCSSELIGTTAGTPIESGNAGDGWGPENAFGGSWKWGGRSSELGQYYLGYEFTTDVTPRCIILDQTEEAGAKEVRVQTREAGESIWKNVRIKKNLQAGENTIPFEIVPTNPPTAYPTAPTPAPFRSPTPPPTVETSEEGKGWGCFSGRTTVHVQGKGITRMDAIEIGDAVLTADGTTYSKVYSRGHFAPDAETDYLQILVDGATEPLEVTEDHMLYVYREEDKKQASILLPAGDVQVGDFLVPEHSRPQAQVKAVRTVKRRGAFAPFTVSGDIVVNGVVASNFIALPSSFQKYLSFEQQHWMQHAAYTPYRLYCGWVGCEDETYDDATGLSKAVTMWLPLLHWLELHSQVILPSFLYLVAVPGYWIVLRWVHLVAFMLGCYVWKKQASNKEGIGKFFAEVKAVDESI